MAQLRNVKDTDGRSDMSTNHSPRLLGKVTVITGCGPNINGGIAYGFADEGAKVVCVDIRGDYAEACARGIRGRGGEAVAATCDVSREEQVLAALDTAKGTFGVVDVLINGAVLQIRKGVLHLTAEEFRRQIDVSLIGALLFTKHVAREMINNKTRGSIISIISTEGHQGNPGNVGYGTVKGGLLNFTRSVAMELAPYGIRVNSLSPTGTDPGEGLERAASWGVTWEAGQGGPPNPDTTSGDQGVPLGKRPSPRHYARGAVFLASDDAEMITGFDLRIDAGTVARYWRWNPGAKISPSNEGL
jgi:NAD(P)-dependent dehydrogenase (short-subunit alcohol dehydrogenase family)